MRHQFSVPLEKVDSELYTAIIRVPQDVATAFLDAGIRRVVCAVNTRLDFHCSLLFDGRGGNIISINQARVKKLGLVQGQMLDILLTEDTSTYGMPMSDELHEVLQQDEIANRLFHALSPGKQRTLIYWSDNVKSSEIKIRRALVMTNHVVITKGNIDFKKMNEEMKVANKRARLR